MTTTQTCILCHEEKPITEFHGSECHSSGIDTRCKTCKNAITRDYKRRKKLGLVQARTPMKKPSEVHVEPFDPELEERRHVQNLIAQFGEDGAKAKIKLEAFAT